MNHPDLPFEPPLPVNPESEWCRPPAFHELVSVGDLRQFLWVAEPVAHEGVYGVSYRVSATLELTYKGVDVLGLLKEAAKVELYSRIKLGEKRGEGEFMEAFMWVPCISRSEDGTISIGNFDCPALQVSPSGVIVSEHAKVPGSYVRPGRFIPLDGAHE